METQVEAEADKDTQGEDDSTHMVERGQLGQSPEGCWTSKGG